MKTLSYFLITASILGFSINSQAASIYAGKAKAAAVCSQCHGIRSTSAEAPFPPLAGRDKKYLESALKQYRDKTRISDIMNNIAGSLSDRDINNIASYYSRLKP
ncbi:cytochrome C [Methylococcaceae bacterium HT1]|nr:cytochrome C [Methylococcaceae bacterium HT1]TXL20915.1 cytochrome C [Methylococcaceae bacterium HT2]